MSRVVEWSADTSYPPNFHLSSPKIMPHSAPVAVLVITNVLVIIRRHDGQKTRPVHFSRRQPQYKPVSCQTDNGSWQSLFAHCSLRAMFPPFRPCPLQLRSHCIRRRYRVHLVRRFTMTSLPRSSHQFTGLAVPSQAVTRANNCLHVPLGLYTST